MASEPRRARIAVMPFLDPAQGPAARGGIGNALAHDVITRLAKLRSLFVIAQGSVFALQERGVDPSRPAACWRSTISPAARCARRRRG